MALQASPFISRNRRPSAEGRVDAAQNFGNQQVV
jgi:hypothetical protein